MTGLVDPPSIKLVDTPIVIAKLRSPQFVLADKNAILRSSIYNVFMCWKACHFYTFALKLGYKHVTIYVAG